MKAIEQLIRKNIRDLEPYHSAREEYSGDARIFLDANENSLGSVSGDGFNRYPDPLQRALKKQLAAIKRTSTDRIFLGNGSDEAIDLLIRAFCEPARDQVMIMPPTYGMYKVAARVNDIEVLEVALDEQLNIDRDTIDSVIENHPSLKLIFICSPNNPTGHLFPARDVQYILQRFGGLVILDEAYIDFSPEPGWLPELSRYDHLVILQTLSKAWGMAGIRLGAAFAHPSIIAILNKIKPPYNINSITQRTASKALHKSDRFEWMVATLQHQKNELQASLKKLTMVEYIFPSEANFLLVRFRDPKQVYRTLIEAGIVVRDRSHLPRCERCLRITVGSRQQNERLIGILKAMDNDE